MDDEKPTSLFAWVTVISVLAVTIGMYISCFLPFYYSDGTEYIIFDYVLNGSFYGLLWFILPIMSFLFMALSVRNKGLCVLSLILSILFCYYHILMIAGLALSIGLNNYFGNTVEIDAGIGSNLLSTLSLVQILLCVIRIFHILIQKYGNRKNEQEKNLS